MLPEVEDPALQEKFLISYYLKNKLLYDLFVFLSAPDPG